MCYGRTMQALVRAARLILVRRDDTMTYIMYANSCDERKERMPVTTFESRAARENWRDVLDATTSGQSDVVITRYGKPVTVMIRYEGYLAIRDELLRVRAEESEAFQTMLASEAVLARDWNTPEEDDAWADL